MSWRVPQPRVELLDEPTPLTRLPRFSTSLGLELRVDVWAKREDLMPIGLGGNKLRNLEFLLAEALAQEADCVVIAGRPESNHCRLAAAAAARTGLTAVLVLSGPRSAVAGPSERICQLLGADMRYARSSEATVMAEFLHTVVDELRAQGQRPYILPPGASGKVGASGQVLAGLELGAQLANRNLKSAHVFVGMATGGTHTGLRVGLWLAGVKATVVGVPTHLALVTTEGQLRADVGDLAEELRRRWDASTASETPKWDDQVVIDELSSWMPFGTTTDASTQAARQLASTEGIVVDPQYTARTAASLTSWAAAGRLTGQTVVLWVGGGTPALFHPTSTSG
jgi:L-cysteate sulfo-lyase